ncbi:MAG: hypothetical protein IJ601_04335 [Acidaminococcaceae bacterium]|nr:hypothetical protein [Acidaminococcaceae bacterium]
MIVSEALIEIRNKINDRDEVGLSNEELLAYFNEAIQFISQYLTAADSPILIQEITVSTAGIPLPENFIKTAGIYPVKITGNTIQSMDETATTIRCYIGFGRADMNEEVPLHNEALTRVAIRLATIYANNQQELDITQDEKLLAEFQSAILSAIGGNKA